MCLRLIESQPAATNHCWGQVEIPQKQAASPQDSGAVVMLKKHEKTCFFVALRISEWTIQNGGSNLKKVGQQKFIQLPPKFISLPPLPPNFYQ